MFFTLLSVIVTVVCVYFTYRYYRIRQIQQHLTNMNLTQIQYFFMIPELFEIFYELSFFNQNTYRNLKEAIIYTNEFCKNLFLLSKLQGFVFNGLYTDFYIQDYLKNLKNYRLKSINALEALVITYDTRQGHRIEHLKSLIDDVQNTLLYHTKLIHQAFNLPFDSMKPVPYKKTKDFFIN